MPRAPPRSCLHRPVSSVRQGMSLCSQAVREQGFPAFKLSIPWLVLCNNLTSPPILCKPQTILTASLPRDPPWNLEAILMTETKDLSPLKKPSQDQWLANHSAPNRYPNIHVTIAQKMSQVQKSSPLLPTKLFHRPISSQ